MLVTKNCTKFCSMLMYVKSSHYDVCFFHTKHFNSGKHKGLRVLSVMTAAPCKYAESPLLGIMSMSSVLAF